MLHDVYEVFLKVAAASKDLSGIWAKALSKSCRCPLHEAADLFN